MTKYSALEVYRGPVRYHRNGYNFRQSIQEENSQLCHVIRLLESDGRIDRKYFYRVIGNLNAFTGKNLQTVRPGYGSTFWSALVHAGVILNSNRRTIDGYVIYVPGDKFNRYLDLYRFFHEEKSDYYRWVYFNTLQEVEGKNLVPDRVYVHRSPGIKKISLNNIPYKYGF